MDCPFCKKDTISYWKVWLRGRCWYLRCPACHSYLKVEKKGFGRISSFLFGMCSAALIILAYEGIWGNLPMAMIAALGFITLDCYLDKRYLELKPKKGKKGPIWIVLVALYFGYIGIRLVAFPFAFGVAYHQTKPDIVKVTMGNLMSLEQEINKAEHLDGRSRQRLKKEMNIWENETHLFGEKFHIPFWMIIPGIFICMNGFLFIWSSCLLWHRKEKGRILALKSILLYPCSFIVMMCFSYMMSSDVVSIVNKVFYLRSQISNTEFEQISLSNMIADPVTIKVYLLGAVMTLAVPFLIAFWLTRDKVKDQFNEELVYKE